MLGSSWRSYDDYIGHRLYYPGLTDELYDQTLSHSVVIDCIKNLTRISLEKESIVNEKDKQDREFEIESWIGSISEKILQEMQCSFNHKSVLRGMYYIAAQLLSRTYHQGVHVNAYEISRLKAKAKELETKKQSLIFLPCHRSHIDYIAIQFICARLGISLPVVVAGDNLNIARVGPVLRQVGALFIRRSFSEDVLYQSVAQAYIETLLKNGMNFECFVEGTRSRTGKLLPPKFGILKYILDGILNGVVEDSWIVPVSTQYDKVAEANVYATELLGKEKRIPGRIL